MTVIGLDDTDSRETGMCTTYVAHRIAEALDYKVHRILLIRLNPAAKYKTRGNAALAIHTEAPPEEAFETAVEKVFAKSQTSDPRTNPAVVVSESKKVSSKVTQFTGKAVTQLLDIEEAEEIIEEQGYLSETKGNGRGRIGALAAIGAWDYFSDWTYEYISYRESGVRGTPRDVDIDSVFDASNKYYPEAWDTVDNRQGKAVCVPNAPGPILHGIRGDSKSSVISLSHEIESEPVYSKQLFITNQGTDSHLQSVDTLSDLKDDGSFKVRGKVSEEPVTKEGGHVFFKLSDGSDAVDVAAFEPTKHFREKVRDFREGDEIIACGEVSQGTIKLEKFKVLHLNDTELQNPTCHNCGRSMESAGKNKGYRCRDCDNSSDSKDEVTIDRKLRLGWHEVPPCARRHISKPLVRGGFDGETHPYR